MSQPALHVVQVSFFVSAPEHLPPQILEGTISLVLTAEAVALGGGRVTVIQACGHNQVLTRNGIDYHFLKPAFGENTISSSTAFRALIRKLAPDVFHVHGLGYPRDTLTLAALAPGVPIFLQDHANRVPRFWHRRAWRRGLAAASGIAFCALAQAQPFRKHGLVGECVRLHEIPECTSRFTPGDRARARELTGMRGAVVGGSSQRQQGSADRARGVRRGGRAAARRGTLVRLRHRAAHGPGPAPDRCG
jgi:hypothetical protein